MAKDCKSKALNWIEDGDGLAPGALGSGVSTASTMPIQQLSAVYLNSFQNIDDENEYDMYSEKGFDLLQLGTTEIDVRQYRDWQEDVRQYI